MRSKKERYTGIFVFLLLFFTFPGLPYAAEEQPTIVISEVSAVTEEWVELYNGGAEEASLAGLRLFLEGGEENALSLDGSLSPGAYTVLDSLPFSLSSAGETLCLAGADGTLIDTFSTGVLQPGHTSGRKAGEATRLFFETPTPGAENAEGKAGYAVSPVLSETGLYHTEAFLLEISGGAGELRYTLDGSVPGENSPLYTEPLTVSESTCLRVRAFEAGRLPSQTVTVTYLFTEPHTVPVVTLAMAPEDRDRLFVAKYEALEVEAAVAYYESDGSFGTAFPAGIAVKGNASRKNKHKSFAVHLRARYGQKSVTYPFWGEGTARTYSNLTLRNGSQDLEKARMRDSFCCLAAAGLNADVTQTRPAVVYVNGAYYGLADLNEGMNQDYAVTHYGVDGDSVNIVEWNDTVAHGSGEGLAALRTFVKKNDLKDDANFAAFSELADVDAFMDYLILQTFFCNGDYHNQLYMGTDDGTMKYRPIFYDLDNTLLENNAHYNNMKKFFSEDGFRYGGEKNYYVDTGLYGALKRNEGWRTRFVERYAELLCTALSVERLETLLDTHAAALEPEIGRNIEKWGAPKSVSYWKSQVAVLKKQISLRHEKIQSIVRGEFDVSKADWAALMEKYGG